MAKRIIKPDSGNTLVLQEDNGSIDALTVETNGDVTLAEKLIIDPAKGIQFRTSTGGSGTTFGSGILDDYEEGTYQVTLTPSGGSLTMDTARDTLRYVKIGNVCHVFGYTRISGVSSPSGYITFNLPFTSASQSEYEGYTYGILVPENILTVNSNEFTVRNIASSSTATIYRTAGGGTAANWVSYANYFQAFTNVTITLTYRTA